MIRGVVFLVLIVGVCAGHDGWDAWVVKYGKNYSTQQETDYRRGIWCRNVDLIDAHNAKNMSYTMGVNKFTDLTDKEFAEYMGFWERDSLVPSHICADVPNEVEMMVDFVGPFMESWDWRLMGVVTPVQDQGYCAGSYAFAASGAIESASAILNGVLYPVSVQQVVDCSYREGNQWCYAGEPDRVYNYTALGLGLCVSDDYPYVGYVGSCRETKCQPVVSVYGCIDVDPFQEQKMVRLLNLQPLSVGVDASNVLRHYSGGVIDDPGCGNDINSYGLVVGYGDVNSSAYWTFKSSWGDSWGVSGYAYIARGKNMCGISLAASYPVPVMF